MSTDLDSQELVAATIASAKSANIIGSVSQGIITAQLDDIGLAGCAGVDVDDIDSEEVTLVAVVIDASSSMRDEKQAVIDAYNDDFLKPLRGAKNADSILVSCWVFSSGGGQDNVRLIHGYTPVPDCKPLDDILYDPDGMTPLNDAVIKSLAGLVSYGQSLRDSGTRTKSIVVVMSDGWENTSKATPTKVRALALDVLKSQEFVLSYCFFGDEADGDKMAQEIGFPPQHRLTSDLDASGVRNVFGQVSASVITTSQAQVSTGSLSTNAFFASP